jgi:hypothetical protein
MVTAHAIHRDADRSKGFGGGGVLHGWVAVAAPASVIDGKAKRRDEAER